MTVVRTPPPLCYPTVTKMCLSTQEGLLPPVSVLPAHCCLALAGPEISGRPCAHREGFPHPLSACSFSSVCFFFFFLSLKEGEFAFIRKVFRVAYSESRMSLSSVSLFHVSLLSFPLLFLASHPNTEGLMGTDNLQKLVSVASCFCSKGWCPVCRQLVPRPQPTGRKWGCYGAALGRLSYPGGCQQCAPKAGLLCPSPKG